ncbi:MAG: hypothetical protein HY560_10215, partial [Gemmatimonadetes bacterium]|nr:hypothetical protein [Gemmatimonadota bacterium]
LRHYLQHPGGKNRQVGRAWIATPAPRDEVWATLVGRGGFTISPASPEAGGPYEVAAPAGDRLSGTVELYLPRRSLVGTVRELGGGLLRLATYRDAEGKTGVWVWLAAYTGNLEPVRAFEKSAQETLEKLFANG